MTFSLVKAMRKTSNIKCMRTILYQTTQRINIPVAFILNYSQFLSILSKAVRNGFFSVIFDISNILMEFIGILGTKKEVNKKYRLKILSSCARRQES